MRDPGGRSLFLVALLLPLAGCLGPGPHPDPALPTGSPFRYACLDGTGESERPCVQVLSLPGERTSEASVALAPGRAGVRVVAAQVAKPPPEWVATFAEGGSLYYDCALAVYVTEDGGSTWSRRWIPAPPLHPEASPKAFSRCLRQPTAEFGHDGRLHLLAEDRVYAGTLWASMLAEEASGQWVATGSTERVASQVYYTSSDDLGTSWSQPAVVALDANHPFLSRHPDGALFAAWRNLGPGDAMPGADGWTSDVAWSRDAGQTWQALLPDKRPGCHLPPRVAFRDDTPLLACANFGSDQPPMRLFRVDAASRSLSDLGGISAEAESWYKTDVLVRPDGALVLDFQKTALDPAERWAATQAYLTWSHDGGTTWMPPRLLGDLLGGSWADVWVLARMLDSAGQLHLLVRLRSDAETGASYEIRHVVLGDRDVVHQATLDNHFPGDPATGPTAPPLGGRTLANTYFGAAWASSEGWLAYSWPPGEDGVLHAVRVRSL